MFAKLLAFLWRDWLQAKSYRLAFLLQNFSLLAPLVLLIFMARLFNGVEISGIDRYGGDYVAFLLLGMVVTTYSMTALGAFSTGLRQAQMAGTLEVLLLTRANLFTVIFGWCLYPYLRATIQMLLYLVVGFLLLGMQLENANLIGVVLTLFLTMIVMGALGILAASFTLVFKQGDPFTMAIVMGSSLISGTFYPVSVLPGWLRATAQLIPQTHSIEAMRLAILQGYSIVDLAPQLGALLIFAVALVPTALLASHIAMHRAKVVGSLAHY